MIPYAPTELLTYIFAVRSPYNTARQPPLLPLLLLAVSEETACIYVRSRIPGIPLLHYVRRSTRIIIIVVLLQLSFDSLLVLDLKGEVCVRYFLTTRIVCICWLPSCRGLRERKHLLPRSARGVTIDNRQRLPGTTHVPVFLDADY